MNEKNGLLVRGMVRKIIEKKPYTLQSGETRKDFEIDLDLDTQRFPFTVTCSEEYGRSVRLNDQIELYLNYKTLNTKNGKAFSVFRAIEG